MAAPRSSDPKDVGSFVLRLKTRLPSEVGSMAWLSIVETIARILSFAYYMLAAQLLAPRGFGNLQYTITISMVAYGATQIFSTTLIRELGAARADEHRTAEVLGSALGLTGGIWAVTTAVCVILSGTGITSGVPTSGFLVAVAGNTSLQTYFSIARGAGDRPRQAAAYAGSSLVQVCTLAGFAAFGHVTPNIAIVIYGATSFVPIVVCELRSPILFGAGRLRFSRRAIRRLSNGAGPLLLAQVGYLAWTSLDQIWVRHALGSYQMGIYAAAKNLTMAVLVVPGGITGVILPRVSELKNAGRGEAARRIVNWGTGATLAISLAVVLGLAVLRIPLLDTFYGKQYSAAAESLIVLGLGMAAYATFTTLTMAAVGWGRADVYAGGIVLAAVLEALLLALHPVEGLLLGALSYAGAMVVALCCVGAGLVARPPWAVRPQ